MPLIFGERAYVPGFTCTIFLVPTSQWDFFFTAICKHELILQAHLYIYANTKPEKKKKLQQWKMVLDWLPSQYRRSKRKMVNWDIHSLEVFFPQRSLFPILSIEMLQCDPRFSFRELTLPQMLRGPSALSRIPTCFNCQLALDPSPHSLCGQPPPLRRRHEDEGRKGS